MALPVITVAVSGQQAKSLVDSGASRSFVSLQFIKRCNRTMKENSTGVMTVSGKVTESAGEIGLDLCVNGMETKSIRCLVMDPLLSGVDMVLGMDFINRMGGVTIRNGEVKFEQETLCATTTELRLEEDDFSAVFDGTKWTVKWKWKDGPPIDQKVMPNYKVKREIEDQFEGKVDEWIANEWLIPYDGPVKTVIPLMAVEQLNKRKVRPVLDFRYLNDFISCYTGDSDICEDKLRAWRCMNDRTKLLDLKDAYLQLHIDKSLWAHQVVRFKGKTYCLTRLGFGLNSAPRIMTHVLRKVLSLQEDIRQGTDNYIDDIIVDERITTAEKVKDHLRLFGLQSKPIERVEEARVLGLQLFKRNGDIKWKRSNEIPETSTEEITRREFFSICGKLVGHYPVCGWLRVACSFAKRKCCGTKWEEKVGKEAMNCLVEMMKKVKERDPVGGNWVVSQKEHCKVWCDASSLAIGVALEENGQIIEDCSWLRKKEDKAHINIAELESVIKGINLALKWKFSKLFIMTDSATVYGWITSVLTNSHKPKVCGLSEMLVKRRLQIVKEMRDLYNVEMTISLVKSANNKADSLTRVKDDWIRERKTKNNDVLCTSIPLNIKDIHDKHHFGTYKTLYCCQKFGLNPSFDDVKAVIEQCERCTTIDPAPIRWSKGNLEVEQTWKRLACDTTTYNGKSYLSVIDCGPSRFTIWRQVASEESHVIAKELFSIFSERGPPEELLMDNSRSFRSKDVEKACEIFCVRRVFRCAYRPAGNGIVERVHRTIKRTAARSNIDPIEAAYWYNNLPKDKKNQNSVPSQMLSYTWRMPIKTLSTGFIEHAKFHIGDEVVTKPSNARCVTQWEKGTVTGINSDASIDVNGVPRHIGDIRLFSGEVNDETILANRSHDSYESDSQSTTSESDSDFNDTDSTPQSPTRVFHSNRPRRAAKYYMKDYT